MSPGEAVMLVALGAAIGVYATAIGAGGGFLLTPLLLLRHPDVQPEFATTASLAIIVASSGLSSVVGLREGRVDRPVALAVSAVAMPAAVLGAGGTALLPRDVFAVGFGALLLGLALYLTLRPAAEAASAFASGWGRELADRGGERFVYHIPVMRSILPMIAAAFTATLAGISGGPIKVPLMSRVMRMPHAVVVPTAYVLNTTTAAAGVAFHLAAGHAGAPLADGVWLAAGMLVVNPLGQRLRRRLGEGPLTRLLALGLVVIAVQTVWSNL